MTIVIIGKGQKNTSGSRAIRRQGPVYGKTILVIALYSSGILYEHSHLRIPVSDKVLASQSDWPMTVSFVWHVCITILPFMFLSKFITIQLRTCSMNSIALGIKCDFGTSWLFNVQFQGWGRQQAPPPILPFDEWGLCKLVPGLRQHDRL
ncbi:uncharacterized protein LACBIDRAFT_322877 [Laccaria bicolor S238N-H82]|uniref:Predicted protein n=1 Tax=Laccaria bicolor (strain S238N-H82 / ATCC MYA-4686) TaxID=486041 RepID=B0CVF2_LACBS|nr:uncharacterized protein LACBIDRAFT_322877 [Laccaria bicolor S238N-H82]EDR13321.1 predicted protein [Laccaria bicolor S238N-H82]|eukprot:XP_001875819.1 predicted protein [Laccaria bicolor S238N-H82]